MRQIVATVLSVVLVVQSSLVWAESGSEDGTVAQIGYGVGSAVGTAVYFPFKAAFCILGGIGSGLTLIFAGSEKANKVASTTCRGTWAITPHVVKGEETVHFVGSANQSAPD